MKLLHKLLLLVLTLSVIPLGVVGYQSLTGLQREINSDLQSIFKEKVSSNGRLMELKMESLEKKIVEAVHFRKLGAMTRKQMENFVVDLLKQFDELCVITILDELGDEVLTGVSDGEVSPLELFNHMESLQPNILEEVHSQNRRFSKITFSRDTARVTLFTPFDFVDRPAKGTVAICVDLTSIQHLIEEVEFSKSQNGMVLLFDGQGDLIAGKGGELTQLKNNESLPYVMEAFSQKDVVPSSTGLFVDKKGDEQMGAYAFLSEKLGWMLFMSEPKEDVFRSADLLFDRTIGVILITVVLSILGGLMMARVIIRPLKALVKGAEEIGKGNLQHRIPKLSSDEIGKLCISFSDMGENLLNREQTIARIRNIAAELNSLFERSEVMKFGVDSLEDLISDTQVELWSYEGEDWRCFRREQDPESSSVADPSWATMQEVKVEEAQNERTNGTERCLVPMGKLTPKGEWVCKGLLILKRRHFGVLDQQIAQILGGAITVSLVNIDFLMESVGNERRAHELEIAELVQKTLYPDADPHIKNMDLGSFLVSSSETGGDWYGYIESPDGKTLSVLVGDVTGHGAPAALITAATNAFFKTVEHLHKTAADGSIDLDLHDPIFLLKLLNRVILETARGRLVMTFFISTIDLETGEMIYANAGHNIPWILRADPEREVVLPPAKGEVGGEPIVASTAAPVKKGGKLKIKVGKKKATPSPNANVSGESQPEQTPVAHPDETHSALPSTEDAAAEAAPKRKIKVKVGAKKSDSTDDSGTPKKKGMKVKIGGGGTKKKKAWENVNARGMRLGEVEDASFECRRTMLYKGDIMVWYTDGWIENTNPEMEEFGKFRCQKVLEQNKHLSPDEMIEKLREASWEFYDTEPREDDVTIVIGKIHSDWGV